jgi:Fe-S cluster assembly ATP-binding protein
VFLAFQYPVEIPGVSTDYFLKAAVNAIRKHREQPELDAMQYLKLFRERRELLGIDDTFTRRAVNEGFSGGEKKRNEVFQMAVVNPLLGLLDETDSGLDIDALKVVANGINKLHQQDAERAVLLVTHYQRLLNYVIPDRVHVMRDGRIVRSGGKELAIELEERGYDGIQEQLTQPA